MQSTIYSLLRNKYVQIALVGTACGVLGLWAGHSSRPEPEVKIESKVIEKTIVDEEAIKIAVLKAEQEWKKLQKTKVVTRIITKADGEKIEETVSEAETLESKESSTESKDEQTVVKKEEKVKEEVVSKVVIPYRPQWSVGATLYKSTEEIFSTKPQEKLDYSVSVGRKVIWDLWVEGSYKIQSNEIGLGLKYEF